jgi:hypothetical protein
VDSLLGMGGGKGPLRSARFNTKDTWIGGKSSGSSNFEVKVLGKQLCACGYIASSTWTQDSMTCIDSPVSMDTHFTWILA